MPLHDTARWFEHRLLHCSKTVNYTGDGTPVKKRDNTVVSSRTLAMHQDGLHAVPQILVQGHQNKIPAIRVTQILIQHTIIYAEQNEKIYSTDASSPTQELVKQIN